MLATEKKWYQIYTNPNCEKKLEVKMKGLGLQVYLPVREIKKQWSDRVKTVQEPAFKSYLFAKLHAEEMRLIERLSEFNHIVSYGDSKRTSERVSSRFFPSITDNTIEKISAVLAAYPQAELTQKRFKKGERVMVTSGSLSGYQGIVVDCNTTKKVAVDLEGLEQSLLISIPEALLKCVEVS